MRRRSRSTSTSLWTKRAWSSAKALEHISRSCFKHAGLKRWACEQLFSGWDDFASKLKAEWLNQSDLRAAGQELLRKTFQGGGSALNALLQEYGDKFRNAMHKGEPVEFLLTAHVDRAIYECGVPQEYRLELLLELERTGVLGPSSGLEIYNTNSYNNIYRSRNHNNYTTTSTPSTAGVSRSTPPSRTSGLRSA